MKNLLQSWDNLPRGWADKNIMLFLDYDGTLAPIADTPQKAVLPKDNKELLEVLVKIPCCQAVIVSGRALADVKAMVGVDGIDYIGNHGWELDGPHIRLESLVPPQIISVLERISYELAAKLSSIEGVLVEDKGITLSVHYRMVPEERVGLVRQIFGKICLPFRKQNKIRIHAGKKVLEVRPSIEWDKGKAALWFLKKQQLMWGPGNVFSIYIGDDVTDEDAFKALKDKGITVCVGGARTSHAQYYLEDTREVTEFLKSLSAWMAVREKR